MVRSGGTSPCCSAGNPPKTMTAPNNANDQLARPRRALLVAGLVSLAAATLVPAQTFRAIPRATTNDLTAPVEQNPVCRCCQEGVTSIDDKLRAPDSEDPGTVDIDVAPAPRGARIIDLTAPQPRRTAPNRVALGKTPRGLAVGGGPQAGPANGNPGSFQAPEVNPTHRVTGRIRHSFLHRSPDLLASGGRPDWPQYADVGTHEQTATVRHATIILQTDAGHYIKSKLDENGEFEFEFASHFATTGTLTVWTVAHNNKRNAAVGKWKKAPVEHTDDLTANTGDYVAFHYPVQFGMDEAKIDQQNGLNLQVTIPSNHASAKPFYMMSQAQLALDYYYQVVGVTQLPKLNVVWTPGMDPVGGETAFYQYNKDPGFIFIPSKSSFDWNGFAVRHEAAHMFQKHYMRSFWVNDNDGGYVRMGEPLANAHACAMIGSPWMDKLASFETLDAQPNYTDGAFRMQAGNGSYWEYCDGCKFSASYGWVQRVLWDLIDGGQGNVAEPFTEWYPQGSNSLFNAGTFDYIHGGGGPGGSLDGGDHKLNDVLVDYLGGGVNGTTSNAYEDRGFTGVCIVDVLDGMLELGLTTENNINTLMNDAMDFGYVAP